jgi:hypothetical protein
MSIIDLAADTVFFESEDDNWRESMHHSEEEWRGNEDYSIVRMKEEMSCHHYHATTVSWS